MAKKKTENYVNNKDFLEALRLHLHQALISVLVKTAKSDRTLRFENLEVLFYERNHSMYDVSD